MSEYLALYSLTAAHLCPVTLVRAPNVWRIDDGYFCFVGTKMWPHAPGVRWPGVSRWRHPDQREYSDPWHYFYYINLHTQRNAQSQRSRIYPQLVPETVFFHVVYMFSFLVSLIYGGLLVLGSREHGPWINDSCQNDATLLKGIIERFWKSWVEISAPMANQIPLFCNIGRWEARKVTEGSLDTGSPSIFLWLVAKLVPANLKNVPKPKK